jgi:hypothetical protein
MAVQSAGLARWAASLRPLTSLKGMIGGRSGAQTAAVLLRDEANLLRAPVCHPGALRPCGCGGNAPVCSLDGSSC